MASFSAARLPEAISTTGEWVRDGTVFYLQDVSRGLPLTAEHTLATVQVRVRAEAAPRAAILLYHRVADLELRPVGARRNAATFR